MLIEGRNINTHKAVHIGHMRNILVSEAVARIEKFAGNEVVRVCYPGDVGAHVAKRLRYYLNFTGQELPNESFTKRVGQLYTQATIKVDEHPDEYKAQIEALQKKLEDGDVALQRIWKETRRLCLADLEKILTELGSSNFDKRYFESEVEQAGIQIVQQMLAEGIAQYSQGAVAINLEAWKLDWFLLLKSTGASLYSTKDIALAYQKKADFPHYAMSLYVVGSEQEHHFQQLFKTLELIGFEYNKLHHLSYGLLDLKGEKMSSRAGNVILYEDFRDQMLEQAETMMKERSLLAEQKKPTARAVAFGAIKFRILLQDSEKKILFDREQALSFEGET
ncbi:MAG: arginine--tRNA ligase [Candidatus Peribacteria bacterium]|nr:arginine--tRNA ligase [Candidatus Peribacteria bacterium]